MRSYGTRFAPQRFAGGRLPSFTKDDTFFDMNSGNHGNMRFGDRLCFNRKKHYNQPAWSEVCDYQMDRKARRKAEREAKKQARIEGQLKWAERRQRAREEPNVLRATKRERKECLQNQKLSSLHSLEGKDNKLLKRKSATSCTRALSRGGSQGAMHAREGTALMNSSEKPKESVLKSVGCGTLTRTPVVVDTDARSSVLPIISQGSVLEVAIPHVVLELTRRCVNKITMANVTDMIHELSEMFSGGSVAGASRAVVITSLMEQIDSLCRVHAGPLTQIGTLPLAGLIRGLQILHGQQVSGEVVEQLAFSLQKHLQQAQDTAAGNLCMVLAQLYLLHGVDAALIISFLGFLFHQDMSLQGSVSWASTSAGKADSALGVMLASASCGLTVLRVCGEKLLREVPREMEVILQKAKAIAARLHSERVEGAVRFDALVSVMESIVSGHTRKGRRAVTELEAPVELMLKDLCDILAKTSVGALNKSTSKGDAMLKRTQRRVIQSVNTLAGFTWAQLVQPTKPPRWYVPGTMIAQGSSSTPAAFADADKMPEDEERSRKREHIRQLRLEEQAIAGQRLHTEHKREIFKAVAVATDDMECFNMLMHRDPTYCRFNDTCAVLIQCCCQEKTFNPYYTQVLERFCNSKSACQKRLQFALWDRFKGIRIESVDLVVYFNLACMVATLIEHGVFTLSVLRGLDLENTNKTIGLYARVQLLRLFFQLPGARLTEVFFGGDGFCAHDLNTDTTAFRDCLEKFIECYFIDESMASRWLPAFYDVVAANTQFDVRCNRSTADIDSSEGSQMGGQKLHLTRRGKSNAEEDDDAKKLLEFMKRVRVVFKALKRGIS